MEAVLTQRQMGPAIAASAVGIALAWLTKTPLGLLAPIAALCLFVRGRAVLLVLAALAAGLAAALLVAGFHAGAMRDDAQAWAQLFVLALCIGVMVKASAAASLNVGTSAIEQDETPPYPAIGPTPREKVAPRSSPVVSIAAEDDKATPALMLAASFWGGTPFHLRYWRSHPDGSSRWTEVRTEPSREPCGTQQWRSFSADVGDQRSAPRQPTMIASNPPSDDEAVQAARIVERLLGNAWAFDATGRPTYLSPFAQSFVSVTLEEFQASVDEGHTVFKRTSHPNEYDRIAAGWRHSLRTGEPFYTERRIRRASGIHDWSRTAIVPVHDREGRIAGWYGASMDLDAYRTAEVELLTREHELSQLVDMVPSNVWRLTPDGEPTFFNKRMVDFLGLNVADTEKPGMTRLAALTEAVVHPDDAVEVGDNLLRSLATGEIFAMRYRLRRADGVYRWMSSRAEPLRDHTGRILHWYGLCHDIDDQMRAEQALRVSKQQLEQMIDAVPINILSFSPSRKLTYASRRYLDQVGSPPPHIDDFGALARDVAHPEDFPAMFQKASDGFETGEPFVNRFRRRKKDGTYRWIEARAQPLRDASGAIVQWYVASIDIDDEMRAQETLRERERTLRQLVETLPAMIDCATPDGEPVYRSQQLREFLGYELEELDGEGKSRLQGTLDAGVHPDDLAGVKADYARSLSTGEPYAHRHRLRRFDGEYRWVETRAAPMRNGEGEIVQWNVICLDIDAEVRAQEDLRMAQGKMARASQAASLAELSASIAHEVNQPLAAIVATSHACRRWLSADPPNLERAAITLERIIRDANSASEVVSRIRALFSKMGRARTPTDLTEMIAEVCHLMKDELGAKRIQVETEFDARSPLTMVDRVQIQQVLLNLIRNAMDALDAVADAARHIRVRTVLENDEVIRVEVQDFGPGMREPEQAFEPFFTTKMDGMGMGLAICRSIIDAHEGRLWAVGNQPRGTTLAFTLPIRARNAG